jgi:hypothetical protein
MAATSFEDGRGKDGVLQVTAVDLNFFDFYRVPVLAGRAFSAGARNRIIHVEAESTRPLSVIVNEAGPCATLGFASNARGDRQDSAHDLKLALSEREATRADHV